MAAKEKIYTRGGVTYKVLSTGIHMRVQSIVETSENNEPQVAVYESCFNEDAIPLVIVFSYNRPEMLLENVKHLSKFDCRIVVIDDGSEYDYSEHAKYCEYQRFDHHGKSGFWKLWNIAFQIARLHGAKFNMITADDMLEAKFDKMIKDFPKFPDLFVCNTLNDGREQSWGERIWTPYKKHWVESGFTDFACFTPYQVLEKLDFKIYPIKSREENQSSGIGQQITTRLKQLEIPMFTPLKSYVYHGDHESVMNPEERRKNPLVSR